MERSTIGSKFKKLALVAAVLAFLAAAGAVLGLFMFAEISGGDMVIGFVIAIVVAAIGYFIVLSMAGGWSAETVDEASRLATTISAMAVGNFNANLHTDSPAELGQIEGALAQLVMVQKGISKDIETGLRTGSVIDEKPYAGAFRDMVKNINTMAANYEGANASLAAAIKALTNADSRAASFNAKTEVGMAFDELRRKVEALTKEAKEATSAASSARQEADNAKNELENTKRDMNTAREEAANARREASAANTEAQAAKREAAAAKRDADRVTNQLRTTTGIKPATAKPPSATPTATAPPAAPRPTTPRPAPRPAKASASAFDDAPSTSKSIKITAPDASHIYDSKNFGKY